MAELDDSEYPPIGVQAPDVPPGLPMPSQSPVVSAPAPVAPPIAPGTPLGSGGQPLPPFQRSYTLSHTPQPQPDQSGGLDNVPIAQASAAISAAMKFQGMRGYQQDLANGKAPADAMARWGPMLFGQGASPKPNFTPTTTTVGGRNLLQMSPNRYTDITSKEPRTSTFKSNPVDLKDLDLVTKNIAQMEKALGDSTDPAEKNQIGLALQGARAHMEQLRSKFMAPNSPADGSAPQRAPVTAPVGAAKANPYKVGKRYGNMRYKGGDPNDQNSWEKVQ